MKTIIFILAMLSINAVAASSGRASESIETCKSISHMTDLYVCDVGTKLIFVSKKNIQVFPKADFSADKK